MEKFNNMTAIWGDQNEKYLRTVVLYTNADSDYCLTKYFPDWSEEMVNYRVSPEELRDMFMKGIVIICENGKYYRPYEYDPETGFLYFANGRSTMGYTPAE